ncbi:MAG: hypothetical protein JWM09_422 [Francisellaceae bacterium]|nr:hypothetical protein [Francisellaceae bacterium]
MLDLNFDLTNIVLSIIFGIIGMGYYSYGKKQNSYFLIAGIALMIYPYFISQITWLIIIGLFLCALPFILSKIN